MGLFTGTAVSGLFRYLKTPPVAGEHPLLSAWAAKLFFDTRWPGLQSKKSRQTINQPYSLLDRLPLAVFVQTYYLVNIVKGLLEQVYGIKTAAVLSQFYGDTPTIFRQLIQYYGNAAPAKRALVQLYGDALAIRRLISHPYALPAHLAAFIAQRYGVAGEQLQAVVDKLWALKGVDLPQKAIAQPYGILGDPSQILSYQVAVTAGGQPIDPLHLSIEASRDQYCLSCEIHCATLADYLACTVGGPLSITINDEPFLFFVESRSRDRGHGTAEYVVRGLSPTARLDAPYAEPVTGELTGLASAIIASLAPGVALSYRTVDWFIPPATLLVSDQTPLEIIRAIAHAAGAIVQTAPDGTLIIEPDYPVAVPAWESTAPEYALSDALDFFTVSEEFDHRDGFNRYLISDQLTSETTLRLEEETISETVKNIRGFRTPWVGDFSLRHTGGPWVTIEPLGVESQELSEVVEFVAGSGRTQRPIYGVISLAWLQTGLGSVTHAEDGRLVAAVEAESLLAITYMTKCLRWKVTNPRNEQVQFVAEEIAP